MNDTRICAPFGTWHSPLDPEALFARPPSPRYPVRYGGSLYWLEARPQEGGRIVLLRRDARGSTECLTPQDFSIRSRVHEYGGRCFDLGNDRVYFCNDSDQRVYVQELSATVEPVPLTPPTLADGSYGRYADLILSPDNSWLFCVMERTRRGEAHPDSAIVALFTHTSGAIVEPVVLLQGSDFYADPKISADGKQLAWLQWQHPYMPWDQSEVCRAPLQAYEDTIAAGPADHVAGGSGQSVCQLGFLQDGTLLFAMDQDADAASPQNFWNLYRYHAGTTAPITADLKEYGAPHWVFGSHRHASSGKGLLLSVRSDAQGDELVRVDLNTTKHDALAFPELQQFNDYSDLMATDDGAVLLTASGPRREGTLLQIQNDQLTILKTADPLLVDDDISAAEAISYPTYDGGTAHGYFYPPCNTRYVAPDGTLPPLLVMVHGGPTARTMPSLDLGRQYWTTRGFAVFDVNHHGSTGYGRTYRQSLLGTWGIKDAADVAAGVEYLIAERKVAADKVCIRGGSAGGYVVLRVLTEYPHLFSAGACYYGIGNLATLAETTHKFELKYTDRLIGEVYDPLRSKGVESRYYQRSPIHFMDRLRCPMIVLQGAEDKVVPPALAREIVTALEVNGIIHEYVEYPNEGHGFRRSETNIDARKRETEFFMKVLELKGQQ